MDLGDASSDSVWYFGGGVRCLIRGGRGGPFVLGRCGISMRIGAVNMFEGKEGAIKLAVKKHASNRASHIDVKLRLVKDACDAGKVGVVYVRTEDQHADLFTKPS